MESANPGPRALRGGDDRKAGTADVAGVAGPGGSNAEQSIPSLRCACLVRRSQMRGRCLSGCSLRRSRFISWPYHLSGLSAHHDSVSVKCGFGAPDAHWGPGEAFVVSWGIEVPCQEVLNRRLAAHMSVWWCMEAPCPGALDNTGVWQESPVGLAGEWLRRLRASIGEIDGTLVESAGLEVSASIPFQAAVCDESIAICLNILKNFTKA